MHVAAIKADRDRMLTVTLDNPTPLHLVCVMQGLPYRDADRLLAGSVPCLHEFGHSRARFATTARDELQRDPHLGRSARQHLAIHSGYIKDCFGGKNGVSLRHEQQNVLPRL